MAIDFTKPATTDSYAAAFVPNIQANQAALAQWLDSAQTAITGAAPTFAKRYNRASSAIEEFNGSGWVPIPLHGITFAAGPLIGVGGTPTHRVHAFSGNASLLKLEQSNNAGVYARWSRPNKEYVVALDINNSGGSDFSIYDQTIGAARLTIAGNGLVTIGGPAGGAASGLLTLVGGDVHLNSSAATDAQVLVNRSGVAATAFGYNASAAANGFGAPANTAYLGVVNGSSTPPLLLITGAVERMRIAPSGEIGLGANALVGAGRLVEIGSTARSTTYVRVNGAAVSNQWLELLAAGAGTTFVGVNTAGGAVNGLPNNTGGIAIQNFPLVFSTGGVESGRFDTAGNFGIGAAPTCKLDVFGNFITTRDGTYVGYFGRGSDLITGGATSDLGIRTSTGNILFGTGTGAMRMAIAADGRVYGSAIHNNPTLPVGTANQPVGASGRYTPTFPNGTWSNITALAAAEPWQWIRVGNCVIVSGQCSGNLTAGGGVATAFTVSLPIPTNMTAGGQLTGDWTFSTPTTGNLQTAAAFADTASGNAARTQFSYTGSAGAQNFYFKFLYLVA